MPGSDIDLLVGTAAQYLLDVMAGFRAIGIRSDNSPVNEPFEGSPNGIAVAEWIIKEFGKI